MDSFDSIFQRAAERKGGAAALEELLPKAAAAENLQSLPDDRVLSEMTKCIFRSGFVWKIVEHKWPHFEAAFNGFDATGCAMLSDEELEALAVDERIIRNARKIQSVRKNAVYILEVREDHGSFGGYLASWPASDIFGLWADLKRRGGPSRRPYGGFLSEVCRQGHADVLQGCRQGSGADGSGGQGTDEQAGSRGDPGRVQPMARGKWPRPLPDFPCTGLLDTPESLSSAELDNRVAF